MIIFKYFQHLNKFKNKKTPKLICKIELQKKKYRDTEP